MNKLQNQREHWLMNNVIRSIVDHLPPKDVLNCRLISNFWAKMVRDEEKFLNIEVILGRDWTHKYETISGYKSKKIPWRRFIFDKFTYLDRNSFNDYWGQIGSTVTHISFCYMKLTCKNLIQFLEKCPSLTHLMLKKITYPFDTVYVPNEGEQPAQQVGRNRNQQADYQIAGPPNTSMYNAYCLHLNANDFGLKFKNYRAAIRALILVEMRIIPVCLLHYLRPRCQGTLEEIQINEFRPGVIFQGPNTLSNPLPQEHFQQEQLVQFFQSVSHTLTKFIYNFNGEENGGLLEALAVIEGFGNLREIKIKQLTFAEWGQGRQLGPNRIPIGDNIHRVLSMTNFLQSHARTADKIEILINCSTLAQENLHGIFVACTNAKIFRIHCGREMPRVGLFVPVASINGFINIKHLELVDRTPSFAARGLDPNFIVNMRLGSRHIKSLTLGLRFVGENNIFELIQMDWMRRLNKLVLTKMTYFSDQHMLIIITNLRQLTELGIEHSRMLTDEGLLGFPMIALINHNNQWATTFRDRNVPGNLKNMTNLKKLSFKGCNRLSEWSIVGAIQYIRTLEELDVSFIDAIGWPALTWLCSTYGGKKFYNFHTLYVLGCRKITQTVVNDYLVRMGRNRERESISKILLSHDAEKGTGFTKHEKYERVVKKGHCRTPTLFHVNF